MTTLATTTPQPPALSASMEQMRALSEQLASTVESAEVALQMLRGMGCSEGNDTAGQLHAQLNGAAGHFRAVRDVIRSMWRAKNAAEREGR